MKILVGTDGSEFSSRALEAACDIAQGRADTTFCVVAAYEAPNPIAAEPYALSAEYYEHLDEFARDEAKNNAKKGVEFIRTKLRDASVRIDEIVELGKPAQIIVETAGDTPHRRLTNGPKRDPFPRWSPDGARLAVVSEREAKQKGRQPGRKHAWAGVLQRPARLPIPPSLALKPAPRRSHPP